VMPIWRQLLPYYDLLVVSQVSTLALHRTGARRRLSLSASAYENLQRVWRLWSHRRLEKSGV
jgi:hypothetical protein